ncbi:transposase [Deferribacter abyssi]|uniref:transposase n=1 Tax=Deferribacter abyssi TaxID=213806 RepID=UPI003C29ED62
MLNSNFTFTEFTLNEIKEYITKNDITDRLFKTRNNSKGSHNVTLICVKGKSNKERSYFITNGHIKKSKEVKRRIEGYFCRWKIEESFRFLKQEFQIEKCIVRKFSGIKTLLGIILFAWHLLILYSYKSIESFLLLKQVKREKYVGLEAFDKIKFLFYRISEGIRQIFLGVKRLFSFRHVQIKQVIVHNIEDYLSEKKYEFYVKCLRRRRGKSLLAT